MPVRLLWNSFSGRSLANSRVLLPTVFTAAIEENMYLLFKNSFNLYHPVCMTETFRNISVYAESLKWLWIHFLFSALEHHVYFNLLTLSSASLACHNNFRNNIHVTACNGRRTCVRTFWATINKSSEADWTARTEQLLVPLLPAAVTTPVQSSTFPQPAHSRPATALKFITAP